jgi:biopolymer transport protein ExbD
MSRVCLIAWQTQGQEWSVVYLWGRLDWISRLDVFVLGLMLAFVVIVVGRGSYRCHKACRECRALDRVRHARGTLTADLSRGASTLRSIAFTAPYLGLAGTCFGILDSFRGVGMQRAAAVAMMATNIAASLLTTASGLLVAFSAASSSNYLLWLAGKLDLNVDLYWRNVTKDSAVASRVFSKYPLKKQFSKLPAFALLAAPSLAVTLAAFMSFSAFRGPVGLDVRLLQPGDLETSDHALGQPLFIRLSNISTDEKPVIYFNSKKTTWDSLDSSVRNNLELWPQSPIYVEADDDVRWAYVAMVIDNVKTRSDGATLLTIAPRINPGHAPRSGGLAK